MRIRYKVVCAETVESCRALLPAFLLETSFIYSPITLFGTDFVIQNSNY